ncbi:hypothetical protein ACTL6U_12460 [Rhodovibrionaceae bacterium A322]
MARTDFDPFTRPPVGELKRYMGAQEEGATDAAFDDLVDMVNPLQHLPVVSTLYREFTGDGISGQARIVGGTLFGGPLGALASVGNELLKQASGADLGEHAMAALLDRDLPDDTYFAKNNQQVASWRDSLSVERDSAGFDSFDPAREFLKNQSDDLTLAQAEKTKTIPSVETASQPDRVVNTAQTAPAAQKDASPAAQQVTAEKPAAQTAFTPQQQIPLTGLAALAAFAADQQNSKVSAAVEQASPAPSAPATPSVAATTGASSQTFDETPANLALLNNLPFRPTSPEPTPTAGTKNQASEPASPSDVMAQSLMAAEKAMARKNDQPMEGHLTGTAALAAFAADLRQIGQQAQGMAAEETSKPVEPAKEQPSPQVAASYPPKSAFMPLRPRNWMGNQVPSRAKPEVTAGQQNAARKGAQAYSQAATRVMQQNPNLISSDPTGTSGVASKMLDALVKYEAMTQKQAQQAQAF